MICVYCGSASGCACRRKVLVRRTLNAIEAEIFHLECLKKSTHMQVASLPRLVAAVEKVSPSLAHDMAAALASLAIKEARRVTGALEQE